MRFLKGNLLAAPVQALVNTVNTYGVMGKGIALQFRERFPQNYLAYKKACEMEQVQTGKMFVFKEQTMQGEKVIINFPTKKHWRHKSQYSYIEAGLQDLVKVLLQEQIVSVALPPLGCGNGGLEWPKVKQMIEKHLSPLKQVEILVYEPNDQVKALLQKEQSAKQARLTDARAMLLYSLFWYEQYGEYASVFAANKIAYLLQESGEDLKLKFVKHIYGPYAQAVEKVLYALNGAYLSGLEQMTANPFEPLHLNYSRKPEIEHYIKTQLSEIQKLRLQKVFKLLSGFESTLSLELLTSVYYLMAQKNITKPTKLSQAIKDWNPQKADRLTDEYIHIAFEHINKQKPQLQLEFNE